MHIESKVAAPTLAGALATVLVFVVGYLAPHTPRPQTPPPPAT
ncbi:hypothetical protein ACFO4E_12790 [Nocardiopsis mangrovi]|uniref:Uncharacterized protein n=1 Tax=Nocardiopsis mangrovi TaxID=1179818 RepID=A0ABV9DUZ7_9ACTN